MNTIRLGDLISSKEVERLGRFVSDFKKKGGGSSHAAIMAWLKDSRVAAEFSKHAILLDYGAYMLEHYLKL